jgi:hypothetical protein
MKQIKIYDDQFAHAFTMANGGLDIKAKNFEWSRTMDNSFIAFVTESYFNYDKFFLVKEPFKIAMILEPRSYAPKAYEWIKLHYPFFNMVLTHDASLLKLDSKFKFFPYGGSWIYEKDHAIYPKTKNLSIVASGKQELPGHILRHKVIANIKGADVYGRDSNKLDYLLDAYKDYKFTISIENEKYNNWFTEKITNPLFCGCVPIYWGCPTISSFFKDIIEFNDLNDIVRLLSNFDFDAEYEKRKSSIAYNLEKAKTYAIAEDWIWNNVLTDMQDYIK